MSTLTRSNGRAMRHPVIEIFAFIALAVGIGLATGIALGGTVLLLSGADDATIAPAAAMRASAVVRD